MDIAKLRVEPGSRFRIARHDPADTHGVSKAEAAKAVPKHAKKLAALQEVLYAEHKRSVLIILQGMDASGKDGTIKHVMSGVNPQGCHVTSFKQPSVQELDHDFLWRIHMAVAGKGQIGIFNRSHYESVLVERVHEMVLKPVWEKRYELINNFEKLLARGDVHILKFFLHISNEEQKKRFDLRLTDPHKNWKASPADYSEREYWDQYQKAYQDALGRCSTKFGHWFVIPANHKWFRNYAVAEIIVKTMQSLKMKYPKAAKDIPGV